MQVEFQATKAKSIESRIGRTFEGIFVHIELCKITINKLARVSQMSRKNYIRNAILKLSVCSKV